MHQVLLSVPLLSENLLLNNIKSGKSGKPSRIFSTLVCRPKLCIWPKKMKVREGRKKSEQSSTLVYRPKLCIFLFFLRIPDSRTLRAEYLLKITSHHNHNHNHNPVSSTICELLPTSPAYPLALPDPTFLTAFSFSIIFKALVFIVVPVFFFS